MYVFPKLQKKKKRLNDRKQLLQSFGKVPVLFSPNFLLGNPLPCVFAKAHTL